MSDGKRAREALERLGDELTFKEAVTVFEFMEFMFNKLTIEKMLEVSKVIGMIGGNSNGE